MTPYTVEKYDCEFDWLKGRLKSVGASESVAVVGQSRFVSPLALWMRKREKQVSVDEDFGPMAEAGHRLEPAISQWFQDRAEFDGEITNPGDYTIFRSIERPHMHCTPDRLIHFVGVLMAELQLKCAYFDAFAEWKERVPLSYQIAAQHSMHVLGTDLTYIAVLGNGYDFRWFKITRNQRFIDRLLARIDAFWGMVESGKEPPADWQATAALKQRYPTSNGKMVELEGDFQTIADAYDRAAEEAADAERRKEDAANRIKQAMGENELAVLPMGGGFSWKANSRSRPFKRLPNLGANHE